ncbi:MULTISPECIES: 4-(cytidine 5'-diphospho)-2-C-methyl-D-erythritol kinase [Acinetobacter]|mgnify:FL=1|jgi:4-diphosphocytidyl-2-C-methyl-D-erythritol kinase|uniref:4-diphosphocytidyl-2-C-methyl-D-erythritol kinase n=2 Tax=Acinetobacter schindleri TaxID=108981 RepID=N9AE60_9GAMM|nr:MULTISPECIES: 4-(cytidine 5'-diphospho)-2-C-methyl-D-erythritol kinase [Acinetobacter]APX63444.1 4-diphosphocytidyl-2-C-methyl-D-erythritol kinase [Acinetobacter schindleri]AWD69304.1 4-(cytidine 5'-diphospho)-2-C-methyl-D-erythritol kinase [Acinetobacter schindleri]ENV13024.1 4-diphosphocytidyl-2-C-methyl-D-erythritol kinase [Acinetobacter schindleri NIPH 900]ENV44379.1 4-diphosphocytidyl-2-C-methyl-D-erythritol kinase [Acinetobacter schindleri CIP 107287]MBB4834429.1 4-diphosphocytidyl-2-
MIRVPSPSKLNLFLHITGRRPDGYHELQSIFQLIDLCDWLEFEQTADKQIQIEGLASVDLEQNLIYRAIQVLKPYAKAYSGLKIRLEKNIPMGAGLGGGSSNAATTLIVVNQLWDCGLTIEQLAELGVKLGADVPIFVYGRNAWAEGIGEHLTFIDLDQKQFIVLKPDCFISTQLLFSQKTLTRDTKSSKFCAYQITPSDFGNNFEPLARSLYPEVDEAMQYLDQFGVAKLTGTGACVFIEVTEKMNVTNILENAPCKAYLVNSLQESPLRHFKVC